MSNEELLTQAEANNMLLHQKTEFRLQAIDGVLESMNAKLECIRTAQEDTPKRIASCKDTLKQEIEADFLSREEFTLFAIKSEDHWNKLRWMLGGAVTVLLIGSWLLNQYSIMTTLDTSSNIDVEQLANAVKKALEE